MTTKAELETKIRYLAQLRHSLELNKQEVSRQIALLENNPAYKLAKEACEDLKASVAAAEAELRSSNVDYFNTTGEKSAFPVLGIRNQTKFEYDPAKALEYCLVNMRTAVTIDTSIFEAVLKKTDLDFVTKKIVPQGTIATDLTEWLVTK